MRNLRTRLATAAAVGAAAVAGAAIANAATSSSGASSSATTATPAPAPPSNMPAHGSATHENAEKPVTGNAATKARAAAIKAVGGGKAGAVTTDFRSNGYEVTVTKSDGGNVEVHLDSSFNPMQGPGAHPGMPPGGPPA